jgi:3D (Asp-Asp-Asp) domain-containing protein
VVLAGALSPWAVNTKTQEVIAQVFSKQETPHFPSTGDRDPAYTQWVVATAYSSDPWQTDSTPCEPAMNFDLCAHYEQNGLEDTIAANFLPLGTKVRLPELYGDKVFVVRDRMNSRYNGTSRIDVWVGSETPTNQEIIDNAKAKAIAFGVKQIKMEVF